jgi:hypothetical protein
VEAVGTIKFRTRIKSAKLNVEHQKVVKSQPSREVLIFDPFVSERSVIFALRVIGSSLAYMKFI